MKKPRDRHHLNPHHLNDPSSIWSSAAANNHHHHGKSKLWAEQEDEKSKAAAAAADGGMDELLAVLGYKVWSSDMAEVALKLEQLEEVMGQAQKDGISQLSDTVHYNPSDLSSWLETMLSELNPNPNFCPPLSDSTTFLAPAESSTITSVDCSHRIGQRGSLFEESSSSDYDLKAIPGKAVLTQTRADSRDPKRLKLSSPNQQPSYSSSSTATPTESAHPVWVKTVPESNLINLLFLFAAAIHLFLSFISFSYSFQQCCGIFFFFQWSCRSQICRRWRWQRCDGDGGGFGGFDEHLEEFLEGGVVTIV